MLTVTGQAGERKNGSMAVSSGNVSAPAGTSARSPEHCSSRGGRSAVWRFCTGSTVGTDTGGMIWHCRCDCGNEVDVSYNSLMYANQKSCGCQRKEHDQILNSPQTLQ